MNVLKHIYKPSLALMTDLYQVTMACAYWKAGIAEREAVFHLFFRFAPFEGGYAVCAGLAHVIDFIDGLRFSEHDIAYLATLRGNDKKLLFKRPFLNYLKKLRFTVDIDAIEEGTVVFPHVPLVRVKGPILQCQLLETVLLNAINFQTLIATKAARLCYAAKGEPIIEFGLRRAQGFDGGLSASRAAYIGGCVATSNLLAGKIYGIPVRGTHAHSWIMAFGDELDAFESYANVFPNDCIFLVDTYDTLTGIQHAITVGKRLKKQGYRFAGIRLDSGDLAYLSIRARKMLDDAGFRDAVILASNNLDEHVITSLKQQGAKIVVWGVGTHLVTGGDQSALDGVYKLSALRTEKGDWEYKLKLSEQTIKISPPGLLHVRRFFNKNEAIADVIYDEQLGVTKGCTIIDPLDVTHRKQISKKSRHRELLQAIFRKGKLVYNVPSIEKSRKKVLNELKQFHNGVRRFLNPHRYPVGLEKRLYELRTQLILKMAEENNKENPNGLLFKKEI